jgi:EAL domain-containing protein (putative c-di-GMP-specific phosphodiesterase class I)
MMMHIKEKMVEFSEKKIRPLLSRGYTTIDILCGDTMFHSSYLPIIEKYSRAYKIDPRKLIIEITKKTKIDAPEKLIKQICETLKKKKKNKGNWKKIYNHFYINEQNL